MFGIQIVEMHECKSLLWTTMIFIWKQSAHSQQILSSTQVLDRKGDRVIDY